MNFCKLLPVTAVVALCLVSCKKDPSDVDQHNHNHEEELITTFEILFADQSGNSTDVVAKFQDLDGAGGNEPTAFDTIVLNANAIYDAQITLLNEAVDPIENITGEIIEEADEHLFCFQPSSNNLVNISITDSDGAFPLGVDSEWETFDPSSGQITITLRHQPGGEKDGTCEPGATDIEINFPLLIQ